jgi:tyrosine-protein kinase Etk/Wzc
MDHRAEDRPIHVTDLTALRPAPLPTTILPRPLEPARRDGDDSVDFVELWETIVQHSRLILGVALAVFLAVMTATAVAHMDFQSTGRLYLGELEAKAHPTGAAELELGSESQGAVGSELEILRSRTLVEQAILESGLNTAVLPHGQKPPRYLPWLWSRRDPELLDRGLRELHAKDASVPVGARKPRELGVKFEDEHAYTVLAPTGEPLARGVLGQPCRGAGFGFTLLAGEERAPHAGAEYDLTLRPLDVVTDEVLDVLKVTAPKGSGSSEQLASVVTLEFTSRSPRQAAHFLNALMVGYLNERQAWKTENASAAEDFVKEQLSTIKSSLDEVEAKLAAYRRNNSVVVLDSEAKALVEQIGKFEEQRVAAELEVAALGGVARSLRGKGPPVGAYLVGEADDKVLQDLASSLSKAKEKEAELETRFNDPAPDVRAQKAQVNAELGNIRGYVDTRLSRAQQHLSALNGMIGRYEQKLKSVPGAELGLAQLTRESEVYNKTYSYLLERQQQAGIIKASTLSKNRILDVPRVPRVEHSPRVALRAALGGLGLVFGTLIVLLRGMFSRTFQSETEVQGRAKAPILATIPRHRRQLQTTPASLGVFDDPASDQDWRFTEAFRGLRTNLYRSGPAGGNGARVILVTSPNPDDGKTTCVSWLAAALAADERRVLVVDADLRKARSSYDTELADGRGLQDILRNEATFDETVQYMPLPASLFAVVSSGGSAPPELLTSGRMQAFLEQVRSHFDYVLIDAPSFPFVSDALILSLHVDLVLSVIRLDHTARSVADEHLSRLAESAPRVAVVVNGSNRSGAVKADYVPRHTSRPPPHDEVPFELARRRQRAEWAPPSAPPESTAPPLPDEDAWFETRVEQPGESGGNGA